MGDLEVAIDELRNLSTTLDGLRDDLMDGDANVDYARSELGHSKVIDAMDEFHSNWDDNREYVASKLESLADLAQETADGFDDADAELAREVAKAVEDA